MAKRIAVIAAHPDDEILGCGATMAMHAAAGDTVDVIFVADGETARPGTADLTARHQAAQAAAEVVGAHPPSFLEFPDNQLDTVPLLSIVQALEQRLTELNPEIVYTHHAGDLNIDHEITHRAVMTACRPQPDSSVRALYSFEVLSSTGWESVEWNSGFRPTRFVDIGECIDKKMAALACYANEMRPYPHARSNESVQALAKFRGASVGLPYAEAFALLREIETRG